MSLMLKFLSESTNNLNKNTMEYSGYSLPIVINQIVYVHYLEIYQYMAGCHIWRSFMRKGFAIEV